MRSDVTMLTFHSTRALERCPECRRPFMCPLDWRTAGDDHWVIALRCGECGQLDRSRMRHDLDVLVAALDRDLIDAADFAH